MDRKFQIFISSTYEDLRDERDAVVKCILEIGHFPVGMEMFHASDESQWQLIQRQIDESDYYVIIIAHRYGSLDASGFSYTEKEYDYACAAGIPTLGFVIDPSAQWPQNKVDHDTQKLKLDLLKAKVRRKLVNFWVTAEDLRGQVTVALVKQFNVNPRPGWLKAQAAVSAETTNELSRLSRENAELRSQILALKEKARAQQEVERADDETFTILLETRRRLNVRYLDSADWEDGPDVSLWHIFSILAPELMIEKSVRESASYLALMLLPAGPRKRATVPVPLNQTKDIFTDLLSLDLVTPSKRRHTVHDTNEYWTLSEYGRRMLRRVRSVEMRQNVDANKQRDNDVGARHDPLKETDGADDKYAAGQAEVGEPEHSGTTADGEDGDVP